MKTASQRRASCRSSARADDPVGDHERVLDGELTPTGLFCAERDAAGRHADRGRRRTKSIGTVLLVDTGGCNTLRLHGGFASEPIHTCREGVAGVVSLVIGRSYSNNYRVSATRSAACSLADLAMCQAPLDIIMTRGVAETLASRAVSGGVHELRASQ
jgi:hypothetical protein